jgi:hypothetical protein
MGIGVVDILDVDVFGPQSNSLILMRVQVALA